MQPETDYLIPEFVPVYCGICGFPVQYCRFCGNVTKKQQCLYWLKENNQQLFLEIYPKEAEELQQLSQKQQGEEKQVVNVEGDEAKINEKKVEGAVENNNEEGEEDDEETEVVQNKDFKLNTKLVPPFGITIKPHVRKQASYVPVLQIRKASRGGRSMMTQIFNFEDFPQITEEACRQLARNLGVGVGFSQLPDTLEQIIMIQGDFVDQTMLYLQKIGVPIDHIFIALDGKHKGKKKAQQKGGKGGRGHLQRGDPVF